MMHKCYNEQKSLNFFTNVFDEIFTETNVGQPTADVIENDNEFIVEIMLPGFKREDVSVHIEDDVLGIEGNRKVNDKLNYNRKGSFFGTVKATYQLPEYVIGDKIDASFTDGVLSITIPKDVESKLSKEIKIS